MEFGHFPATVGIQLNGSATPPSGDVGTFFYEQLITKYNIVYYNGGNCSLNFCHRVEALRLQAESFQHLCWIIERWWSTSRIPTQYGMRAHTSSLNHRRA